MKAIGFDDERSSRRTQGHDRNIVAYEYQVDAEAVDSSRRAINARQHHGPDVHAGRHVELLRNAVTAIDVGRYLARRQAWSLRAKCIAEGIPTAWFFPEAFEQGRPREVLAYCSQCPVQLECLEYGMSWPGEVHGYFGGLKMRKPAERMKAEQLLLELRADRATA